MTKELINQLDNQFEKEIAFLEDQRALRIGSFSDSDISDQVGATLFKMGAYFEYPDTETIFEFCGVFKLAYPNMAANELRAAVRLNEAGKLGRDQDNRIFYGRKFSIQTMMSILHAYDDEYRKKMVGIIVARQQAMKQIEEQRERDEKMAALYALEREKLLSGDFECTSWKDVNHVWFDIAEKDGLLVYKEGQKRKIWEDAKVLASEEIATENMEARQNGRIGEVISNGFELAIEYRAKVIARQIAVFRLLIEKEI